MHHNFDVIQSWVEQSSEFLSAENKRATNPQAELGSSAHKPNIHTTSYNVYFATLLLRVRLISDTPPAGDYFQYIGVWLLNMLTCTAHATTIVL